MDRMTLLPLQLSLFFPFPDGLSFVVLSFAFGKGQGNLGLTSLEVDLEGNEGLSLFFHFTDQTLDFLFVQEEFSGPSRFVVSVVGKGIGADVHVVQKGLSTGDLGVAVLQVRPSQSQGLHLRTLQDHTGFVCIQDEVVMPGLAILAYGLCDGCLPSVFEGNKRIETFA